MFFSPSMLMFLMSILTSIIIMISSSSLFFTWIALELNTLSFIPLILTPKKYDNSEAAIKYFLSQTLASILFLISISVPLSLLDNKIIFDIMIFSTIMIKLGAAPFHSWLPSMVERLMWPILFILLSIQKMNPITLLILFKFPKFIWLTIFASLLVGSIMGLIQTQTRKMLTYSSINHMGWIISSTIFSLPLTLLYFIIYTMILMPVIQIMHQLKNQKIHQISNFSSSIKMVLIMFLTLLSLGGLPPFLGFLPKMMVIQALMDHNLIAVIMTMFASSLITLMFYLRLTFAAFILNKNEILYSYPNNIKSLTVLTSFYSLTGLMFFFLI